MSLRDIYSGYAYCSGALLNENTVVTSAYCYKSRVIIQLGGNSNATKQTFVFKNFSLDNVKIIFLLRIPSSRFIRHPNYNSYNQSNDIALINHSFNIRIWIFRDIEHVISRGIRIQI